MLAFGVHLSLVKQLLIAYYVPDAEKPTVVGETDKQMGNKDPLEHGVTSRCWASSAGAATIRDGAPLSGQGPGDSGGP